jgi:hypothetical protein
MATTTMTEDLATLPQGDLRLLGSLRPDWAGVTDFSTRFPGGSTAEQFAQRGRS